MHPEFLPRPEAGSEQAQIAPRHREYRVQPRCGYDLIEPLGKLASAGAITGIVGTAVSQTMNISLRIPVYLGDSLAVGAPESITAHPNMVLALLPVFAASYALTHFVEAGAKRVFCSRQARRSTPTRSQEFIKQMRVLPSSFIDKLFGYVNKVSPEVVHNLETE